MAIKKGLIRTTDAARKDLADYSAVSSLTIDATIPTGCDMRFAIQIDGGTYKKYDTTENKWADLTTQNYTAASLLTEGNTKAELEALTSTELAALAGKTVAFPVAMSMDDTTAAAPSIGGITVAGITGDNVVNKSIESGVISLSDMDAAVDILDVAIDSNATNGGNVKLYASIKDENNGWSNLMEYTELLTVPAKAVKFKAVLNSPSPGVSSVTLNSVSIRHRTDNVAVFTEGTGVCITKTIDFVNSIGRAHAMIKHPIVADTEVRAYIALREPPVNITGEVLGTGDGTRKTFTLAHIENLASHNFVLYYDGEQQAANSYSFSTVDGQVSCTPPEGAAVTCDYVYGWEPEKFVEMTRDDNYPDKNDSNFVDEQFDYVATNNNDPTGSVGVLRIELEQKTGKVKNEVLGTGTGALQAFKLPHHAKIETLNVSGATTWKFNENTDVILARANEGAEITASYDWAARANYLESIACIFNE